MSKSSSSSPGNEETSSSSSHALVVASPDTRTGTSDQCSGTPHPTASFQLAGNVSPPTKVPSQAESYYVAFCNQQRHQEALIPDPTGPRSLPSSIPTKFAVLAVLSTKCWLSAAAIQVLLKGLSYRRSKDAIRLALDRCTKFGLAESQGHFRYESSVAYKPGAKRQTHRHRKWKLTERGRQYVNSPGAAMKAKRETSADLVREVIARATAWVSVSEIREELASKGKKLSASTVRKKLREEAGLLYKCEKIPGDRYGRFQWAFSAVDTTGWSDASIPVPLQKASSKPKTPAGSPASVSTYAMYGGLILMCAPTNKPTLIKAIGDLLVNEFVTCGKTFTAHDVTKRLRELVLKQAKDIDDQCKATNTRISYVPLVDSNETGVVHVQGLQVPKIDHEDVKNTVHDIFNAGGMPGIDRIHGGTHWEYDTVANIAARQPASLPQAVVVSDPSTAPGADPAVAGTDGSSYDGSSTI